MGKLEEGTGHRWRGSDTSLYDLVCENCGCTDEGGRLEQFKACPARGTPAGGGPYRATAAPAPAGGVPGPHADVLGNHVHRSLRYAGDIARYHTWPIAPQSVAAHSWNVMRIYLEVFGSPPPGVWQYMLLHDAGEMASGDVPFYAKRAHPILKQGCDHAEVEHFRSLGLKLPALSPAERARVRACDMLEMWEYAHQQLTSGNLHARAVVANVEHHLPAALDQLNGAEVGLVEEWVRRTRQMFGEMQHGGE